MVQCVEESRYREDLSFIAQPRPPGSAHWMAVQDLCRTRFEELGFDVELHAYGSGVNVVGTREGARDAARRVLIGAHYDHIPGCAGADDNASGVAGVLEAARVLSTYDQDRTLVVACWDEEESGLIGSEAYVAREVDAGRSFDVHFNLEMIGYVDSAPDSQMLPGGFALLFPDVQARIQSNESRGDFIALIGDASSAPFIERLTAHADRIGLPNEGLALPPDLHTSPLLSDLRRSDHDGSWQRGIPAIMITDTSEFRYVNYHCAAGEDSIDQLDTQFATQVVAATVGAAADALAAD